MCLIGQKFPSTNQNHYPDLGSDASSVQNFCTVSFLTHFLGLYLVQFSSQQKSYRVYIVSGFVLFFEQIIQGLARTFEVTFLIFQELQIQCKKEPWVYIFFSSFTTGVILSWGFLCLLLFLWNSTYTIKLALKFKDFPAPTAIFKDFQGCEFSF